MKQSLNQVYFVSLGCPKNLVDSQVMLGKLGDAHYGITKDPADADVIIVNTCSFIQAAKEESIETILEMAQYKETAKCKALVVSGCLPQRYSKELLKEMPEIDMMIGTGQYQRITEILSSFENENKLGSPLPTRIYIDQPAFIHTENDSRVHSGPAYTGFLKLSEGCIRNCSFCIIPTLRGDVRSRSIESLVSEAQQMAGRGVRELNLVAQDLTHYGIDKKFEFRLETLLPKLAQVDGIEWIRLHYVYPDQFSDELVQVIAETPKIVPYLDMPIQHTSDRILRLMNRRLSKKKLFELITKLRDKIPHIVFRTSIIVGFPGETEADFEELTADLLELKLDYVGVFRYSKEDGTKAATLADQVHPSVRRKRWKSLTEKLSALALEKSNHLVGKRVMALVEGPSAESELFIQARLSTQAQEIDGHVMINDLDSSLSPPNPGDLVEVEISEVIPGSLIGKMTKILKPFPVSSERAFSSKPRTVSSVSAQA
jgi:ribosomal protein S12 methylthiotransferase